MFLQTKLQVRRNPSEFYETTKEEIILILQKLISEHRGVENTCQLF